MQQKTRPDCRKPPQKGRPKNGQESHGALGLAEDPNVWKQPQTASLENPEAPNLNQTKASVNPQSQSKGAQLQTFRTA